MKRILITGANSYIGTSFEKHMAQWPSDYHVDTVDMMDDSWRGKSFSGFSAVVHVAGIAHQDSGKAAEAHRELYKAVNTDLAIETADKAKRDGVKLFVFFSSMSIYGMSAGIGKKRVITKETEPSPSNVYGESKLLAEKGISLFSDERFAVCILRPPMIYGPNCKGNYVLLEKAALKLPIFPDIENERSMLHIGNLCIYLKSVVDEEWSGTYFPQDDKYVCTSRMVREIAMANGRKIHMTSLFNPLLRVLSGKVDVVNKVFGNLTYEHEIR